MSDRPQTRVQPTATPGAPTVLDGVLDRLSNLSLSLYIAQQNERNLIAELEQARDEIDQANTEINALIQANEALSLQVSQQGHQPSHVEPEPDPEED